MHTKAKNNYFCFKYSAILYDPLEGSPLLNMDRWVGCLQVDAYSPLGIISMNCMWGDYTSCGDGMIMKAQCGPTNMFLRPLKAKVRGQFLALWLSSGQILQFVIVSFQSSHAYHWIKETPLPSASHLRPDGFWLSLQRLPNPCSNFNQSTLCGGANWTEEAIPNPHISADSSFSPTLSLAAPGGGREGELSNLSEE